MPDPNITATQVDDVIVTARRNSAGLVEFFIRFKTLNAARHEAESRGDISRARFLPNVRLLLVDETGVLPTIVFEAGIPAEALQSLINALNLYANPGSLSPNDASAMADLFGAFDHARNTGVGIRFAFGPLPRGALMGAVLDGTTLQASVANGFMTIRVNPSLLRNPRSFGDSMETVLYHELMHLNPAYSAASLARYNRGRGGRPFDQASYNRFHQTAFWDRAEILRNIIRRNLRNLGPRTVITGTVSSEILFGSGQQNEVFGIDGADTLQGVGICDFLYGGPGNDRYVFLQASQAYKIHDDGGDNVLEVQGPYTVSHVRLGNLQDHLLVSIVDSPSSPATAYDMGRVIMVPLTEAGQPVVATLEIGGVAYALPSLTPLHNSRPELVGPTVFDIPESQFTSGQIGYIVATERDGEPMTYYVDSVTGLGDTSSWWIQDTLLRTNFLNPGIVGQTALVIRVSDGRAEDLRDYRINWKGRIRG